MELLIQNYGEDTSSFDYEPLIEKLVYVICGEKEMFVDDEAGDKKSEGKGDEDVEEGEDGGEDEVMREANVGSGFPIFNDGDYTLLAASAHVIAKAVKDDYKIRVMFTGDEKSQQAFIVGDFFEDIGLLVTKCGKPRSYFDISLIPSLKVGSKLHMSSHAGGSQKKISSVSGKLTCERVAGTLITEEPHASVFMEMWLGSDKGSSGAAIVDDSMILVAIMSCSSLCDVYVDRKYQKWAVDCNLKAAGDHKYGVSADRLRFMICEFTRDFDVTVSYPHRLKSILMCNCANKAFD